MLVRYLTAELLAKSLCNVGYYSCNTEQLSQKDESNEATHIMQDAILMPKYSVY
jgi:hypothetical protein